MQRSFLLAFVATCWTWPQSVRYPANFYASSSSIETWLERDSIRANRRYFWKISITTLVAVLEYCALVWHYRYALTKTQNQEIEAIQKRAVQIRLKFSREMLYSSMLLAADVITLSSRREEISQQFLWNITKSTSCLHHLLPDPKMESHYCRLKSYEHFPRVCTVLFSVFSSSAPWAANVT